MKKVNMILKKSTEIAEDTFEFQLENEYVAQKAVPGQFLHLAVENFTLRRPISIANIDKERNIVTILFKVMGKGTEALSHYKEGTVISVLGPNGNGFTFDDVAGKRILLVGGGIGVPPLYYLGKQLRKAGADVVSVLGFQKKSQVFYEEKFQQFGKTYITTDDGSYGEAGFVTTVCERLTDIDQYYTVGPIPMLRSVIQTLGSVDGYISLEERMGCAIGACYACVIKSAEKEGEFFRICEEGPVFKAKEVAL